MMTRSEIEAAVREDHNACADCDNLRKIGHPTRCYSFYATVGRLVSMQADTARRCAAIAESAQGMPMHVEGARAVAAEIRREFKLEE